MSTGQTTMQAIRGIQDEKSRIYVASQWQLVWWRFRKHKLALISLFVVLALYLTAVFAEFLAPYRPNSYNDKYALVAAQQLHLVDRTEEGWRITPFVYDYAVKIEPVSLKRVFVVDTEAKIPVAFFAKGEPYKLWGLFPMQRHLITSQKEGDPMYLFGTDRLGRDMLSRAIYGARISMSIGLVGVAISLSLGVLLGGISGYYGGLLDDLIQRVIEFIRSIPTIPLWLGLAAAIPSTWPPVRVYFAITLIVSLVGWTGLARVVRGRFLALREEDFVVAARLGGSSEMRIVLHHMMPSFLSHLIASVSLAIPNMILSETSLSFLGVGLRPPAVSWGVLLQEAQNIRSVAFAPWLLYVPAVPVLVAVLSLNFLGDGLRDAADPYE
jgi:peptide/nickel transport system permease protein